MQPPENLPFSFRQPSYLLTQRRAGFHSLRIGRLPKKTGYLKTRCGGFQVARIAVAYSDAWLAGEDVAVAYEYLAAVFAAGFGFAAGNSYA